MIFFFKKNVFRKKTSQNPYINSLIFLSLVLCPTPNQIHLHIYFLLKILVSHEHTQLQSNMRWIMLVPSLTTPPTHTPFSDNGNVTTIILRIFTQFSCIFQKLLKLSLLLMKTQLLLSPSFPLGSIIVHLIPPLSLTPPHVYVCPSSLRLLHYPSYHC